MINDIAEQISFIFRALPPPILMSRPSCLLPQADLPSDWFFKDSIPVKPYPLYPPLTAFDLLTRIEDSCLICASLYL
jgi:hypothetical protein